MAIQSKTLILGLAAVGGLGLITWTIHRRRKLNEVKEFKIKLRQQLEGQLCFGRPKAETSVVTSMEDWSKVEDQFLRTVDATRMIGLDCEWLSDGDTSSKVALMQVALTDGLCILLRTCQLQAIPESLKHILSSYDVIKFGVAVCEDGRKLFNDFGVEVNGTVDLRFLVQRYCPGKFC